MDTPWIAARGAFVVVVWGAGSQGKADIFCAVSREGGGTFRAPVRVNTIAGEGRLGGEPNARQPGPCTRRSLGPAGRVFVAWDELLGGRRVAAVRELPSAGGGGQGRSGAVRLSGGESGAYPVLAWADCGLLAVWTAGSAGDAVIEVRQVADR